jgi:hypothetical protein
VGKKEKTKKIGKKSEKSEKIKQSPCRQNSWYD